MRQAREPVRSATESGATQIEPMAGFEDPVETLPGVGPRRAAQLRAAGVATLGDLLRHLPQRYEDRTQAVPLERLCAGHQGLPDSAPPEAPQTVVAKLVSLRSRRARRRRLVIVEGVLAKPSGAGTESHEASPRLPVVWFNRPYLERQVSVGRVYRLCGRLRPRRGGGVELLNPSLEDPDSEASVTPVYGSVGELPPSLVRQLAAAAIERLSDRADPLPDALLARRSLPPLGLALRTLHAAGGDRESLVRCDRIDHPAFHRLVYGELLELQLAVARERELSRRQSKPHSYRIDQATRSAVRSLLPFRLTPGQRTTLGEIVADLRRPEPMLRLLQGDVGCGKTIVAALAMAVALESGLQCALMAPTELLAEQHALNLERILGHRYPVRLLTSGASDREDTLSRLSGGEPCCVVGTHALIEEGVHFGRLALAVIDEQQRFGVRQRQRLGSKGEGVDVLVMTATPIPRSLALTLYGELDLSVIDSMPPGRHPVETRLEHVERRPMVWSRIREEIGRGGQAFVVFPLIEDSAEVDAATLESVGAEYASALDGCACVARLTGRVPAAEREAIMARFVAGEIGMLLATTVVEVGVDVPNASLMVIESGERFGLSQLHQLRGRVGRGARHGRCVVVHDELSDSARQRLESFAATLDGFRLAEADLALRGPGEVLGARQSGQSALQFAHPVRHLQWLEAARSDARELIREAVVRGSAGAGREQSTERASILSGG